MFFFPPLHSPIFLPLSSIPHHLPFFFFNHTATTEIYTLSLHDALPISRRSRPDHAAVQHARHPHVDDIREAPRGFVGDRKSTRLNSSHSSISYAVFCLKKKKNKIKRIIL